MATTPSTVFVLDSSEGVAGSLHTAMMGDLKSNKLSCTTSGCHDTFHPVDKLGQAKFWKPTE